MSRYVGSLILVACVGLVAVADIPPPPPDRGFKRVPYEHVLKLDAEIPGYRFYPFSRLGLGGNERLGDELKLDTKKGVVVESSSSPSVRTGVVAVPDKVMDKLKTKDELGKLLSWKNKDKLPDGVVVLETRGTSIDLKESDPRAKVEYVVTVSADDKAGVKFVGKETAGPSKEDEPSESASRPPFALLIGGGAAALAVVALGVWVFRRK